MVPDSERLATHVGDYYRRKSVISLELRVANLSSGGRQRRERLRLSGPELWDLPAAGGWSRGRR
jgi:hypothetical protein